MKIVFLSSEVAPFAKTGGLADVTGSLPRFLAKLGLEVRIFMPLYREVQKKGFPLLKVADRLPFHWAGQEDVFTVWESAESGVPVYFIDKPAFYDRDGLYGTAAGDYKDNGQRFAFFSQASLAALKAMDFAPDVIHVHDWQSAIALAYLKSIYGQDPFFQTTKSLCTIHNLAYQGLFERDILKTIGLPESLFDMDGLEFFGKVNFLKAGILYATAISTVSYRYSCEIQTPEFGCGLDGLLRKRSDVLTGILNGVDYAAWDPAKDSLIAAPFTASDPKGKEVCKKDLQTAFGLPTAKKDLPVIGMVSRLAGQKGLDMLIEALGGLFPLGVQLVILGTGEAEIQESLETARRRFPSFFGLKIAFDDRLAHKIYAGSDMFLMPSRYEPCGLTQMYSLKYGAIPIVRATGGLDDSIREYDAADGRGNGFKFEACSPPALIQAVQRALKLYAHKRAWAGLVQNAMACDFSWERAAQEYVLLYQNIREERTFPVSVRSRF
ncbi:MAG: glycogen synthase GlgA [Candidatus Aminicenantes bacterium]|nr:glycogen synthase GlgA [Candidatus Aminicenantes bacterium]